MFQAKSKKKGKPAAVHSKSTSSVISDLSNPSGSDDSEHDEISIPDAIEERSFSEENPSSHTRDVKDSDKSKSDKSKRSKKKSKNAEKDDNDSDGESSIKSDGVSKKRKKRKKKKKQQLNDLRESEDEDLFEENEALQEEVISLRRKMNLRGDAMEMIQLQMDLKRAVNEASELKSEIDEYEEAVSEKDGLIKKLTEAVDCQLDKVEYLELKLQRAEDEFVKMEGSFSWKSCYLLNSTRRAYTYLIFCASSLSPL
jgi:chromosome segregation ATPase